MKFQPLFFLILPLEHLGTIFYRTNRHQGEFTGTLIPYIRYTETEAEKKFGADNIKVYASTFTNMMYSMTTDKPKMGMKLICTGENETVIGLHVAGLGSDEMLQGFGVAVKMGATKRDFDNCIAIHPTASEEFVTMARKYRRHKSVIVLTFRSMGKNSRQDHVAPWKSPTGTLKSDILAKREESFIDEYKNLLPFYRSFITGIRKH